MNISAISRNMSVNSVSKMQNKNRHNINFKATREDFDIELYRYYQVVPSKINILHGDEKHLVDVGEHLRTTDDDVILECFCTQRTMGIKNYKKAQKAFIKIKPYVDQARTKYDTICKTIKSLDQEPDTLSRNKRLIDLEKIRYIQDKKADSAIDEYCKIIDITPDDPDSEEDRNFWDSVMY